MRRFIILMIDIMTISAATVAAMVLRKNFDISSEYLVNLLPYLGLTLAIAIPVLLLMGLNRLMWRLSSMQVYMRIVVATTLIVLGAVLIGFLGFRLEGVSRALPVLQWMLMIFLLVGGRVFVRQIYRERAEHHARNKNAKVISLNQITEHLDASTSVLIIGINPVTELYLQAVEQFANNNISVAGILGRHDRHTGRMIDKCKVLGSQEDVTKVIETLNTHGHFIDRIVLTMAFDKLSPETQGALLELEKTTEIKLDIFTEKLGLTGGKSGDSKGSTSHSSKLLFSLSDDDLSEILARPYWRIKRLFDFALAAILIVILAPVMAVLTLLVAIDLGAPIIFWQNRPGFLGRPLFVYKFRTMRGAHNSRGQKISDDERQTVFGWFLRRLRLDELPQLFNILIGDMSFIGPRPLLPIDQSVGFAARLLVRPGLSGWAQVHGGREILPADKAALDVWYVDNASFALDIKIFARTIAMVIFGEKTDNEIVGQTWRDLQQAGRCASMALAGNYPNLTSFVSPRDILQPTLSTGTNTVYNNYNKPKLTVAYEPANIDKPASFPEPAQVGGQKSRDVLTQREKE